MKFCDPLEIYGETVATRDGSEPDSRDGRAGYLSAGHQYIRYDGLFLEMTDML